VLKVLKVLSAKCDSACCCGW